MGITGMMYTGLSGLTATGRSIGVTGDNIANLNTIGYRGSRAIFEEVLNRAILGVGEVGGGSRIAQIEKLFHQGPIVSSPKGEDMAISGRGFFAVKGVHNGVQGTYYTRAGRFNLDNQGFLATFDGLRLQGYPIVDGETSSRLGELQLLRSIPPRATSSANMEINFDGYPLDPAAPTPVPFDPANPEDTSDFTQGTVLYDSRGTPREVTVYFTRTAQDTWEWNMAASSSDVATPGPNPITIIASGSLNFDTNGVLQAPSTATATVDFTNATPGQVIDFDFANSTNTALSSSPDVSNSTVRNLSQDGFQSGSYVGLEVREDGSLVGKYDNDQQVTVGRLALADFSNQTGLNRVGGTYFTPSETSGEAVIGFAGSGGRGTLRGNALEQSNVELSEEFVKLITDQRGYQAQSRTITTADELLSETVNLKR